MLRSVRHGFTLVEVLVALVLSGLVAVGVHDVFVTMADGGARLTTGARELDAEANRRRFLRHLVASIESTGDADTEFDGDSLSVAFSSWCATAHGWFERCHASLELDRVARPARVMVQLSTGGTFDLFEVRPDAELRYLSDVASGGQWAARWPTGILVPRAIGIINGRDTIILRIGDRG